jgi:hypothetical protein
MIIETKEVYKCEHCRKMYQIKSACEKHELICNKNTSNHRACMSCPHLIKKTVDVHFDNPMREETIRTDVLFCPKINSYLYPPKIEVNKNWFEGEDIEDGKTENNPMPISCEILDKESIEMEVFFIDFLKQVYHLPDNVLKTGNYEK